jgi:O-antigen/teichoic acid export membrane protein
MGNAERRVAAGVAAHLYAQAVTVFTQLASLPLFLERWSAETYGRWLVLSAVPIYLSIADLGVLSAAANMMAMYNANSETDKVRTVFRSAIFCIAIFAPAILLVCVSIISVVGFGLSYDDKVAISALVAASILTASCGLFDAAYRPFGLYPRVTFLLTTTRLVEWGCSIVGLYLEGGFIGPAIGLLVGRTACCIGLFALSRIDVPYLDWNIGGVDLSLAKKMAVDGMHFFLFPIGNLIILQGTVVLVGASLGGVAASMFSSFRTVSRLLAQVSILVGKSLAPEVSRLNGMGMIQEATDLCHKVAKLAVGISASGAIILAAFGGALLRIWSHGKIPFDPLTFNLLMAAAVLTGAWQIYSTRLTAINEHRGIALAFIVVSLLAIVLASILIHQVGLAGVAVAVCLSDAVMLIVIVASLSKARVGFRIRDALALRVPQRSLDGPAK